MAPTQSPMVHQQGSQQMVPQQPTNQQGVPQQPVNQQGAPQQPIAHQNLVGDFFILFYLQNIYFSVI